MTEINNGKNNWLILYKYYHFYNQIRFQTDYSNTGDTENQNDRVRKQYESLPYPLVSEDYLKKEEEYYLSYKEPIVLSPSMRLEKLNHYLYQGRETFR